MSGWFFTFIFLFVLALAVAAIAARRQINNTDDFMMAGSNLGFALGSLTVAATLFSTLIVLGMPDFFRQHGIGAWIFLGVTDAAMPFMIIWFGLHLRRCVAKYKSRGMAELLTQRYDTKWAGYLYAISVFIFLIPYVAIQLRGVGVFLNASFPGILPVWGWATVMVMVMLAYSESGGLKAIILADAMQGLILLTVILIIAYSCITYFGGVRTMFEQVRSIDEKLLSIPGPEGLFSPQFLIISFLAIVLMPATQPQLVIRLMIMRDLKSLHNMALILGCFAMVIILALVCIGMYGAVRYHGQPTDEFLQNIFVIDQKPIIAAAIAVGLIAAAISTSDSLLFALGNELRFMLSKNEQRNLLHTRIAIICFALIALLVAILSNDQFVLLARVSFVGTALMTPFIFMVVFTRHRPTFDIVIATAIGLTIFLFSLLGFLPSTAGHIRVDLALLVSLSIYTLASLCYHRISSPPLTP